MPIISILVQEGEGCMPFPKKDDVVLVRGYGVLGIVDHYNEKNKTLLMQSYYNRLSGECLDSRQFDSVKVENIKILTVKEVFEMLLVHLALK